MQSRSIIQQSASRAGTEDEGDEEIDFDGMTSNLFVCQIIKETSVFAGAQILKRGKGGQSRGSHTEL